MKYLAFLRGINVGGHKQIKMAALKALFESLGLDEVETYIQSGNVVFRAKDLENLKTRLETAVETTFGFQVPLHTLSHQQLKQIIDQCPYSPVDLEQDGTRVLVTFLAETPTPDIFELLNPYIKPPEQLVLQNQAIYISCPNGYGKTKLSNTFIESKLKTVATTRNWKTIVTLEELSRD